MVLVLGGGHGLRRQSSAIDAQVGARHEGGQRAREEQTGVGHFAGLADAANGVGSTPVRDDGVGVGDERRVDDHDQSGSAVAQHPMSAYRSTILIALLNPLSPGRSVEMTGFEPVTFALQRRCSPAELHPQDSAWLVGLTGFEPVTPALSAQCSNQLSYKPESCLPSTTEK